MSFKKLFPMVILLVVMFILGCSSGGGTNATTPDVDIPQSRYVSDVSHASWGMWQFTADTVAKTLDVIQLRTGDFHLNALPFLEPPPLVNLTLETVEFNGDIIETDIGLRHPFLGLTEFTGFDVCGIFITNGSVTGFENENVVMAGEGDTRLLNPDGYSRWWNPAEFPVNDGTMFAYNDGILGAPDSHADYNSTINAYKYFCDDLEPDDPMSEVTLANRGMFSAGVKNIRHYTIELGDEGLIFNYAVDACWIFPSGESPWEAPDDFAEEANRPEAYNIVVTELSNDLFYDDSGGYAGGNLELQVDVYDHFNDSLNTVHAESLAGIPLTSSTTPVGGDEGYSTYELTLSGSGLTQSGDAEMLITVQSEVSGYGDLLPDKPVCAYFTCPFIIGTMSTTGWARTWGGITDFDLPWEVAVDDSGNSYVAGMFDGSVDFDPDPVDEDIHVSINNSTDAFLVKYDLGGDFQWALSWGGSDQDHNSGVAVDGSGNVYVTGEFRDTVDFDPGTPVENITSEGSTDVYLSKFDSSGVLLWVRTWGEENYDSSFAIAADDSGNVYVAGEFDYTVDFDPGAGTQEYTTKGWLDVYVSKFDSSGDFQWARTWGGMLIDHPSGVAVDGSGNVYVTGYYWFTVDFDPDPVDEDVHASVGQADVYISKFDSTGDFQWALTWGGTYSDVGSSVAVDASENVYVTGSFVVGADFDPDPAPTAVDNHASNDNSTDAFLSKFQPDGDFIFARTWGGAGIDTGIGVALHNPDVVYITGKFAEYADLDPGFPIDNHSSNGDMDVYLSKFDSDGIYEWARTWGDSYYDAPSGIDVDYFGNAYVAGSFEGLVDFDPDPVTEDNHASNGGADIFLVKILPDGYW